MEVEMDDILAMYVVSPDGPKDSPKAFKILEEAIGWKLLGRKFFGTMLNGEYRANLAVIPSDNPEKLGFPTWEIPGGKYWRTKIRDWEKHIAEIAPRCEEIKSKVNFDNSRPIIEYYRSIKELFLHIPCK